MTIPRLAAAGLVSKAVPAPTLPAFHDAHASSDFEAALHQGDTNPSDVMHWILGGGTVDPVIVAKVALQARLQESISRRELDRERERRRVLEALVRQLTTELTATRQEVARLASFFRNQ
jgi:hypothetical protein